MWCEWLGNYWYGFYDMVHFGWFGWWSDQYSCDSVVTWLLWYTSCLYMIDITFILICCGAWASYWRAWMCCDWLVVRLDIQRQKRMIYLLQRIWVHLEGQTLIAQKVYIGCCIHWPRAYTGCSELGRIHMRAALLTGHVPVADWYLLRIVASSQLVLRV